MAEATTIPRIAGLEVVQASSSPDFVKGLIYGDPGSGKTWLVSSAEDVEAMRPVLLIDMEGGIISVKKKWPNIHVVRVKDTVDPRTKRVTKMAWQHLQELYEHLKTRQNEYKTIILDSVTEAYSLCMRWVMYDLITVQGKDHRDSDIPDKKEYAKARSRVHLMMRSFRDLEAHVIMTALKDVKTNQDTGAIINYIPALPGKLAYEVGAFMDQFHFLYVEQVKDSEGQQQMVRRMLTQPVNKYLAKDRSDGLPLLVEEPTMTTVWRAVTGKEDPTK